MYRFFIKHKNNLLLILLFAVGMAFTVNSCDKDNKATEDKLECSSFVPPRGTKNTPVILYGKGFGTDPAALEVKFNNLIAQVSKCDGDEMIVLTPEEPGASCTISVSKGKESGQFSQSFTYIRGAQECDSFEPLEGYTGTPVTLTGKRFGTDASAVEVRFNGKLAVVTDCEDTQIVALTPEDIGDECDITVKINNVTVQFTQKYAYHAFILESFSPEEGGPGEIVTLTGSMFGTDPDAIEVMFNDKPVEVLSCANTEITVKTPAKSPGKDCIISLKKGQSSFQAYPKTFTYNAAFELESFEPLEGGTGTHVTLSGDGFGENPGDIEIFFDGQPATVVECTNDHVVVATPDALDAECTISVKMGPATDNFEEKFSYISALTLREFYPLTGTAATQVTLKGYNFGDDPANVEVKFNDMIATVSACFHDSVHVLPPRAPGDVCTIQVTKGTTGNFTPTFAYLPTYWITNVAGTQGQQGFQEGTLLTARFDPKHIVCDQDGNLIVVSQDGGNYSTLIDFQNNNVKKLVDENYGQALNAPCISPDGLNIFIPPNNTGWGNGCLNETETNNLETGVDYFYKLDYNAGSGWSGTNVNVELVRPTEEEIDEGTVNFWLRAFKHSFAYSTYDNKIYYRSNSSGGITKFDPETYKGEWALDETGGQMFMMPNPDQNCVPNNVGGANPRADSYLAFDPTEPHMLYGALSGRNCIASLNTITGETKVYAGGDVMSGFAAGYADGSLAEARFNGPMQIAFDNGGNMIVADRNNHRVRKIDRATGMVSTIAGNPTGDANASNGDSPGEPVTIHGSQARFRQPFGVAVAPDGSIYVADRVNRVIRKIIYE